MKIAYILQCHINFKQIIFLIDKLLYKDLVDIYIHVDKKNTKLKNKLKFYYNYNKNIIIIDETIDVKWGGFTQVEATLLLIKHLMYNIDNYSHISLISGQDFPLKSSKFIYNFLISNKEKSFLDFSEIDKYFWRLQHYNFYVEIKNNRILIFVLLRKILRVIQNFLKIKRVLPHKKLYIGSSWWTLNKDAIKYVYEYEKKNHIRDYYKYTINSDEHFFQNILLNSHLKDSIINDNLRTIQWENGKSSPKTFCIEEIQDLKIRSNKLFLRKVKFCRKIV